MTVQLRSASKEALELVSRLRKPRLTDVGPASYWHELNLLDAGRAIDALIAQRVSAERERIASEFRIPVLALTARPGEITEADKAWADGVIQARAPAERPAPEAVHLTLREQRVMTRALLRSTCPAPADVVDYTDASSPDDDEKRLATIRGHFEAYAEEHPEIIPEQRPLQCDGTGWWSDAAFLVRILNEREVELARLQASPAAVVDYTERARELLLEWMRSRPGGVYQSSIQATELKRLVDMVADALSAVASERDAAAIRAFGKRVWSDTEEVAYQAGVTDERTAHQAQVAELYEAARNHEKQAKEAEAALLARLQEPDVREAVKAALEQGRPHWITGVGPGGSGLGGMADAALTKIAEMLKP